MTWTGGCLCGAVRYESKADPMWLGHGHCRMCRKQTGALVGTYVGFPAGTVRWTGIAPSRYRSSKEVERSFCPKCGGDDRVPSGARDDILGRKLRRSERAAV